MPIINPELQSLIPALSQEEYNQLEKNIIADGCRDPLVLWDDTIIDGHNRFKICTDNNISFSVTSMIFDAESDVRIWMIRNQFGRRNISNYQSAELALELKPLLAKKAKETQGQRSDLSEISTKSKTDTREEIAKEAGVSSNTISKVERIQADATEEVIEQVKSGDISINKAYQDIKTEEVKEQRRQRAEEIKKGNSELDTVKSYRVIYADPPWKYGDERTGLDGYTAAVDHYPTMSINEMCEQIPVKEIAEDDAVLFMWVTSPLLYEAHPLIEAWGFKYKACFVWDKVKHNVGHYNSVRHEFLLICTKGSCTPDIKKLHDSVVELERSNKHSEKPDHFRHLIDSMYPNGDRVELFRRGNIPDGWNIWGNQADGE